MTELAPRFSLFRQPMGRIAQFLAMGSLVVMMVVGCDQMEIESESRFQAQIEETKRELPELIRKFKTASGTDSGTRLVWSGEGAQVLEQRFEMRTKKSSGVEARWDMTLKTTGGRFFDLRFVLRKKDVCKTAADCLIVDYFVPRTQQEMKARIVRWGDAKLYQDLFNEPMPPREIPA